jgi:DnaJ-class molecular chaperone
MQDAHRIALISLQVERCVGFKGPIDDFQLLSHHVIISRVKSRTRLTELRGRKLERERSRKNRIRNSFINQSCTFKVQQKGTESQTRENDESECNLCHGSDNSCFSHCECTSHIPPRNRSNHTHSSCSKGITKRCRKPGPLVEVHLSFITNSLQPTGVCSFWTPKFS